MGAPIRTSDRGERLADKNEMAIFGQNRMNENKMEYCITYVLGFVEDMD